MERVRQAYGRRAGEYTELLGTLEATAPVDRELIGSWAQTVRGLLLDVGCGPGHWTGFLRDAGAEVRGIDPVPEFLDAARERHPGVEFDEGRAEQLDVEDAALGGILAWYSLIHLEPSAIGVALGEFARCLRPGGGLLIGVVDGPEVAAFDHAVVTAYAWPVQTLATIVEQAGFEVLGIHARQDAGARPHGAVVARRSDDGDRGLPQPGRQ